MRGKNLSDFLGQVENVKQKVIAEYPEIDKVLDDAHAIRRETKEERIVKSDQEAVR